MNLLLLGLLIAKYMIDKSYTYMPDIVLGKEAFGDVRKKLYHSGLEIMEENIAAAPGTTVYLADGDSDNPCFKVTAIEPEPGAFVKKKDIVVKLEYTWENSHNKNSVSVEDSFDINAYYKDIDIAELKSYHTDRMMLFLNSAGLIITADGAEEQILGINPQYLSGALVEAELVDYATGRTVQKKTAYMREQITFSYIPEGVYYYTARCDGYDMSIPKEPFRLEKGGSGAEEALQYDTAFRETGKSYSAAFKVKLQNERGEALSGTEVHVTVVSDEVTSPDSFGSLPFVTDEDGFLTLDGELAEFEIFDGSTMQVFRDFDEYFPVETEGDIGICTLSGQGNVTE